MLHPLPPNGTLRVAISRNWPETSSACARYPVFSASVDCFYPGWCMEVVSFIAQYIGARIEPILMPYDDGLVDWGTLNQETGNWSGVLGYLQRDEVDTACLMYQRTVLREKYFEFATSVVSVKQLYTVKERQEQLTSKMVKLLSSFNSQMWASMIGVIIFQMLLIEILLWIERRHILKADRHQHFHTSWSMLQLILKQREEVVEEIWTLSAGIFKYLFYYVGLILGKITMVTWSIAQCVLIVELYRILLVAQLLRPQIKPIFRGPDEMIELIASGRYHLITDYIGLWYFDELGYSNASHYVKLRAATLNNPVQIANSSEQALDYTEKGNYIYPNQEDGSSYFLSLFRCHMAYIGEGMPEKSAHFAFQKHSPWLPVWNEAIRLTEHFQQSVFRKYFREGARFGKMPKCDHTGFEERPEGSPLDFDAALGPLLMLGCGLCCAIVAGVVEYGYYKFRKSITIMGI